MRQTVSTKEMRNAYKICMKMNQSEKYCDIGKHTFVYLGLYHGLDLNTSIISKSRILLDRANAPAVPLLCYCSHAA